MTNRQFPGNFGKFRRRTAEYVVLAVALIQGVLTAPAQSRVMNQPPSNEVIYARPEIAAALAEHYEALEGDVTRPDIEGGNPSNRGGNLLGKPANVRADSTPSGLVRIGAGQKFGSSRNSNGIVGGHSGRSPNDIRVERSFRNFDGIGGGHPFGNLDGSGAGESARNLDSIGGGNLVRALDGFQTAQLARHLDGIGGGNMVRSLRNFESGYSARNLDSIGGGNLVRSANDFQDGYSARNLDSIGGGNLVRRSSDSENGYSVRTLDSIGRRSLAKNPNFVDIDDEETVWQSSNDLENEESAFQRRPHYLLPVVILRKSFKDRNPTAYGIENHLNLDAIGGGNLLKK
ncbi:uncharacterized protein LOC105700789 isoform X1 [Orussus abietinus]|uniref:uncharacterized protein LOC105700789 isoform X1 n=1 Tax=Orussus abietinus TaxID=222816 RepID=UPI0006265625|nr:uncharacterized protein LOC105700789 isoform X1 [Orussus abietinus]